MSELVKEVTELVGIADGLIFFFREREWTDCASLGGEFMCEPQNATWLADHLDRAAADALPDVEHHAAPDHFIVDVRGGELGAPININVLNRRARTASHGKTYALNGMSPETARKLARELRECVRVAREA